MTTEQELIDAKVATEDIIADLERVTAKIRKAMIRRSGPEIHAQSPELFQVALALAKAHAPLWNVRANLVTAIGMHRDTRLVPGLF